MFASFVGFKTNFAIKLVGEWSRQICRHTALYVKDGFVYIFQLCAIHWLVRHSFSFVLFFGNFLPVILVPSVSQTFLMFLCNRLWFYLCASVGEWRRYRCAVCEWYFTPEEWNSKLRSPYISVFVVHYYSKFQLLLSKTWFFLKPF